MNPLDPGSLGRRPRPRRSAAAAAATLVLAIAACGGGSTSASPAGPGVPTPAAPSLAPSSGASTAPLPTATSPADEAALYGTIEDQVIAERELPAKKRLEPTTLTESEVKARLEEQFRKENPPEEIAVAEETLSALGLLPPRASLADLYVEMLGSQVAGFYDSTTKQLYVVSRSGSIEATEKSTFAHEFTHALQDQNFGLEGIAVDAVGQGDRSLGRLALVEGDATLAMSRWMFAHLTPADLGELLKVDPDAQAQLERMPAILRETLLFPYQQGLVFANQLWSAGGWTAVDDAYSRLPDSTEQVLHPDKYAAGEKPVLVPLDATALATAMGAGWTVTPEDTLGEFQLSVWLRENGVKALDAQAAAAGWGGDRYVYLRGPDGAYALALDTAWDTSADATEFLAAAATAASNLPGAAAARASRQSGGTPEHAWVLAASDAATLDRLEEAALAN